MDAQTKKKFDTLEAAGYIPALRDAWFTTCPRNPDYESVYWPGHEGERINSDPGGVSGGPVFRIVETPMPQGKLKTRIEVVGLILEEYPTLKIIVCRMHRVHRCIRHACPWLRAFDVRQPSLAKGVTAYRPVFDGDRGQSAAADAPAKMDLNGNPIRQIHPGAFYLLDAPLSPG